MSRHETRWNGKTAKNVWEGNFMTGQTEPTASWSWMDILREHPERAVECLKGIQLFHQG